LAFTRHENRQEPARLPSRTSTVPLTVSLRPTPPVSVSRIRTSRDPYCRYARSRTALAHRGLAGAQCVAACRSVITPPPGLAAETRAAFPFDIESVSFGAAIGVLEADHRYAATVARIAQQRLPSAAIHAFKFEAPRGCQA
jgi:hypothetical protein